MSSNLKFEKIWGLLPPILEVQRKNQLHVGTHISNISSTWNLVLLANLWCKLSKIMDIKTNLIQKLLFIIHNRTSNHQ